MKCFNFFNKITHRDVFDVYGQVFHRMEVVSLTLKTSDQPYLHNLT